MYDKFKEQALATLTQEVFAMKLFHGLKRVLGPGENRHNVNVVGEVVFEYLEEPAAFEAAFS